jgi:serine/threonine protein kinase
VSGGSPPTSVIDNRYRITDQIGSGGFATVWRAEDRDGGPDIAVKFPETQGPETHDSDEVMSRFKQELEVHSAFEGAVTPNSIVRFIAGDRNDPPYIGMEYLNGNELSGIFDHTKATPGTKTLKDYGLPVLRALEYLHINGYCHLDCRPRNVIVRKKSDVPALIDFNTAVPISEGDSTLFHEDPFKPPEQTPGDHQDDAVGPWSDVYAAGKILSYLLSGARLSTSETPEEGMDPREYGSDCPRGVAKVVQQATHTDPDKRPSDAQAMYDWLTEKLSMRRASARLKDLNTEVTCLIRSGDTVGRLAEQQPLPDISVADPRRYISLVHFECNYDDSWHILDRSLNGTYIRSGEDWTFLRIRIA